MSRGPAAFPPAAGRKGWTLGDDAPVALAEIDQAGRLVRTNARFRALTGRTAPGAKGDETLAALLHEDDRAGHEKALGALQDGEAYRRDERYVRPDGTVVWATNEIAPLPRAGVYLLAAGAAAGLVARAEAARERAESAVRHRDDFLSLLSHELRSPLAAILVWARLLRDSSDGAVDAERGLEVIERSGRALERILDDLVHVSRISSGKLLLTSRCTLDLRTVAQAALDALVAEAGAKGVLLEGSRPAAPVTVDGDPGRLQQAITNILSNAVAFTPSGGRVEVRLETRGSEAVVRVTDTGEGMDPEFIPAAFERFRQGDSGATRSHHGLGLGLYIARHLAELHGGRIAAESPGRGQGSTFTITLPLVATAPAEDTVPCASDDPLLPSGLRVLVVDDDDDTREALRLILKQGGAEVETAASAAEALERLLRRRPELVLSDIAMPGEDGLSFIRRVRALPPEQGGSVPAAALTAYASPAEREGALRAGFDLHVAKPVDPPELLRIVATLARRSPAGRR